MTDQTPAAPQFFAQQPPMIGGGANLSAEQSRELALEMVRHGHLSQDQADKALRESGHESAPADTRTDSQKCFDASFPSGRPEDFNLNLGSRWRDAQPDWVNDVNRDTTNFLGAMAMPPSLGAALAERIFDVNAKIDAMRGPDRALWLQENKVHLQNLMGDNAALRLESAVATLKARGGAYLALITAKGIHNDVTVAANLILHADRLKSREGLK